MAEFDLSVSGTIISGHGVASGRNHDPRFPEGTLALQQPVLAGLGLDLSDYYLATLNISIHPLDFRVINADWHYKNVQWHPTLPAEDFSFVQVGVDFDQTTKGLLYSPHPETKPEHFQPDGMMEVILNNYHEALKPGTELSVLFSSSQIELIGHC